MNLRLRQTVGDAPSGGAESLFTRATLDGLPAGSGSGDDGTGDSSPESCRLEPTLGYGSGAFGNCYPATPEIRYGRSGTGRHRSIGWRLEGVKRSPASLEIRAETSWRQASDRAESESVFGLSLGASW